MPTASSRCWGLMDITVERNAFGRQVDSFEIDLEVPALQIVEPQAAPYHAVFIRAPLIESVQGEARSLASLEDGRIVAAQQGRLLATSFHPELTGDDRFHRYFLHLAEGERYGMSIRPFDWRDLPALHRYRNQSVFLDSSLVLTRGPMLLSGAILSTLAPAMGITTTVSTSNSDTNQALIGQFIQSPGSQIAQLTFLAPQEALQSIEFAPLLEFLCAQAVDRGALRLLADVDEDSPVFEALRQSGFAIYARQRIWRLSRLPASDPISSPLDSGWRPAEDRDLIGVRSLYNNLVPGLVQQVEPFPADRLHGFVFCQKDGLLAYVEVRYGHRGIWVQPFVHPDAEDVGDLPGGNAAKSAQPPFPPGVCVCALVPILVGNLDRSLRRRAWPAPGHHGQASGNPAEAAARLYSASPGWRASGDFGADLKRENHPGNTFGCHAIGERNNNLCRKDELPMIYRLCWTCSRPRPRRSSRERMTATICWKSFWTWDACPRALCRP